MVNSIGQYTSPPSAGTTLFSASHGATVPIDFGEPAFLDSGAALYTLPGPRAIGKLTVFQSLLPANLPQFSRHAVHSRSGESTGQAGRGRL